MLQKSLVTFSLAAAVALTTAASFAQEALTVLGPSPVESCAAAAAKASTTGSASVGDLQTCSQAINWAHKTPNDVVPTIVNRGVLQMARGDNAAAIADFDMALRLKPTYADALNDRGAAQWALRRYEEAKADFTRALALSPSHPEQVYFNRALAYEDSGDLKHAFLDYKKAAETNPTWDKPAKELARFSVGRAPIS